MKETLQADFANARRPADLRRSRSSAHPEARPPQPPNALARPIAPEQTSPTFADLYGRRFAMALAHGHWDAARAMTDEARQRLVELESTDPMDESVFDVDWHCPQNNTAGILFGAGFDTIRDVADGLGRNQLLEIPGLSEVKVENIRQAVQRVLLRSEQQRQERDRPKHVLGRR